MDPRPYPIGFIGRLDPIKRAGDFLEAIARLPDWVEGHIFGDGPELAKLRQRAEELGVTWRMVFHGMIAGPQQALEKIGMLVLPSEAEGFPLVLIEAMAGGVPIVASDAPGIRDVLRHEQTGLLVPVAAPDELARAMRRVMEDKSLRGALVERAGREVREHFTWKAVLPQYWQLLGLGQSQIPN
jgi:glycosyltransferase involved in cell wall biosynthesis